MGRPSSKEQTTNNATTTEDTLTGLLADAKRNIKKVNKGVAALSELGTGAEITAAKTALTQRKEAIVKGVLSRVADMLMKYE